MDDYNLDLLKYDENKNVCDFLDLSFSYGFIPLINRPTRITNHTATIIDHIYTNNYNVDSKLLQGILITDVSDHFAIFHITINESKQETCDEPELIRQVNERNLAKYDNEIRNVNWSNVYECSDAQTAFTKFVDIHTNVFNRSFPIIPVKKRYRNRLPWLTQGLKISIKTKNNLYKTQLKYPSAFNFKKYSIYKNALTSQIKKAEKNYYQVLITENKSSMRKTWNIIKNVISKNKHSKLTTEFKISDSKTITDKKEISNRFNNYFVNVGLSLANKIPTTAKNYRDFLPPNNTQSMYIEPVTSDEIKQIIKNLNDGAPGHDDITAKCIKFISNNILEPLVFLTNLSFTDGIFPDELKIAKVCPLYKANDPTLFNNYRPISLLTIFSKIYERLMYNRLLTFLKKNAILYKYSTNIWFSGQPLNIYGINYHA